MPLSSMRWWSRASASRREFESNSSSVWAGVSKGSRGQGEVTQVHQFFSLSFCIASGDGRGSGAGSSG